MITLGDSGLFICYDEDGQPYGFVMEDCWPAECDTFVKGQLLAEIVADLIFEGRLVRNADGTVRRS